MGIPPPLSSPREAALLEAVRVKPNARAMKELRSTFETMDACAVDREDHLAAGALRILIEMHDKVAAVLAEYGVAP